MHRRHEPVDQLASVFVNLSGAYGYLEAGYLASMDAEVKGFRAWPSTADILDAYTTPVLLERAAAAGIPAVPWQVRARDVEVPCLIEPLNPTMSGEAKATTATGAKRVLKRMTMNFAHPVAVQPLVGDVHWFKAILGMTTAEHADLAWSLWTQFRIPLARVRVQVTEAGDVLLSGIQPLELTDLTHRDLLLLKQVSEAPLEV